MNWFLLILLHEPGRNVKTRNTREVFRACVLTRNLGQGGRSCDIEECGARRCEVRQRAHHLNSRSNIPRDSSLTPIPPILFMRGPRSFFDYVAVIEKILTHLPACAEGRQGPVARPDPQPSGGVPVAVFSATGRRSIGVQRGLTERCRPSGPAPCRPPLAPWPVRRPPPLGRPVFA